MSLKVKILTVDGPFWEASAEEVILPSTTGQLGVLTGHIHLLTGLDTGVMRAKIDKKWVPIVLLNGGFAEIVKDVVKITTYIAIEGSKLNREEVEKEMEELTVRFNNAVTAQDKIDTTLKLQRARAKVQAARFVSNNP